MYVSLPKYPYNGKYFNNSVLIVIQSVSLHTDKLTGDIESRVTTGNQTEMQDRKYRSCELWYKETDKKKRNNSTLMGQKLLY